MPVLMLAARAEENSVTSALQAGANDYMAVPFRRSELLARVRMHLRSSLTRGTDRNMGGSSASGRASRAGSMNGSEGGARPGHLAGMVPVLAGRVNGMRAVCARLKEDALVALLGSVRDTVDTLYEKYAVVKVGMQMRRLLVMIRYSATASSYLDAKHSMLRHCSHCCCSKWCVVWNE